MNDDDKALVDRLFAMADEYDSGHHESWPTIDALEIAAHRIEALSAENERLQLLCDLNAVPAGIIEDRGRMEERAAIVAWHRQRSEECLHGGDEELSALHEQSALDIEAGEHLK